MHGFVDDLTVYSRKGQKDYLIILENVLRRLYEHNAQLCIPKCQHNVKQLKLLGYLLEVGKGIRPDPGSVQNVLDMKPPRNMSQLQSLVGALNWVARRMIPSYAEHMIPITDLLKNPMNQGLSQRARSKARIQWTQAADHAFEMFKRALADQRVQLIVPVRERPGVSVDFLVSCDASEIAISGVLWQRAMRTTDPLNLDPTEINQPALMVIGIHWSSILES